MIFLDDLEKVQQYIADIQSKGDDAITPPNIVFYTALDSLLLAIQTVNYLEAEVFHLRVRVKELEEKSI